VPSRKEEFNEWIESVFDSLRSRYINCNLDVGTESLKDKHWYQLWRIFENYVEAPRRGAKERMESLELADYEAGSVILDAHRQSSSNFDWNIQMDHYMNSGKYD